MCGDGGLESGGAQTGTEPLRVRPGGDGGDKSCLFGGIRSREARAKMEGGEGGDDRGAGRFRNL